MDCAGGAVEVQRVCALALRLLAAKLGMPD